MKNKQRIDQSEEYFVHVGYTFAQESLRYYVKLRKRNGQLKKDWYKPNKLKVRPVVEARLKKLNKYWTRSLK